MNLLKLTNEIALKGGVSYNLNTGEMNPSAGFMVSFEEFEKVVTYVDEPILKQYIAKHSVELSKPNSFLGVWYDGRNYVLDVSENIPTKRDAMFWAIVRKQKCIWDCAKQDEVWLPKKRAKLLATNKDEFFELEKKYRNGC